MCVFFNLENDNGEEDLGLLIYYLKCYDLKMEMIL